MDWDDVRVFLAVAREGSMRAAGRALGLSQPTIARRLAAFEATSGGQTLFDRLPEGLRLNAAGEQLVPAAESVERAALMLERRRAAASPGLSGTVRVSVGGCSIVSAGANRNGSSASQRQCPNRASGSSSGAARRPKPAKALAASGLEPSEIDLVIVATCSPESPMPNVAATVAYRRLATGTGAAGAV